MNSITTKHHRLNKNLKTKKRKIASRKSKRILRMKHETQNNISIGKNLTSKSVSSTVAENKMSIDYIFMPHKEIGKILSSSEGNYLGTKLDLNDFANSLEMEACIPFKDVFNNYYSKLIDLSDDSLTSSGNIYEKSMLKSKKDQLEVNRRDVTQEKPKIETKTSLSNRMKRLKSRMSVLELKKRSERPEIVEVWDPTAPDPLTLIYLKNYRNTFPVPRHWSQKRKYLQGKRGIEKPPFKLPSYLEATGVCSLRDAYHDKEETKKLKQKGRERLRPKIKQLDINYEILRDAFFKNQTKPNLTPLGDLYYEGKEFELSQQNWHPGTLSTRLKEALGMGTSGLIPPPWLINMQRYGPPPSYPGLKIPGLNTAIPAGCRFGYGPGEWGKPPVDQEGSGLYGDVFGINDNLKGKSDGESEEDVIKTHEWGRMQDVGGDRLSECDDEDCTHVEGAQSTLSGISSLIPQSTAIKSALNLRKEDDSAKTPGIQISTD